MSITDKRLISILLIISMVLINFVPVVNAATSDIVTIKDATLAEYLLYYDEDEDGKMSKTEMEGIPYIQISKGVSDLTGLEYAKNIRGISYEYSGKKLDFSKLNLNEVTYLYVSMGQNEKIDLSFIEKFSNLVSLTISAAKTTTVDLNSISKCTKLEYLSTDNIAISSFSELSKLSSLDSLYIHNYATTKNIDVNLKGIENLKNLNYFAIDHANIKNANILSNLSNLESLALSRNTGISNLSFLSNNKKLRYFSAPDSDLADISFVKSLDKLTSISISGSKVTNVDALQGKVLNDYVSLTNLNIKAQDFAKLFTAKGYTAYLGEKFTVNKAVQGVFDANFWQMESDNENILKISYSQIEAVAEGTATIKIKSGDVLYKTLKITVKKTNSNTKLGTKSNSELVDENVVLKANGDLMKVYSTEGKAEKIDSNVKKYVYGFVYADNDYDYFQYNFTQKKDGKVTYTFNGVKKSLDNVKDVSDGGYLGTDGNFYRVQLNGSMKKTVSNVEKIVGNYVVGTDGKTYNKEGKLIAKFKIKESRSNYIIDENNVIWQVNRKNELSKAGEDFKNFATQDNVYTSSTYFAQDGSLHYLYGSQTDYVLSTGYSYNNVRIDKDYNLLLNNTKILSGVKYVTFDYGTETRVALIIRSDGTMWRLLLDGNATLEKVTEQTSKVIFANDTKIKTRANTSNVGEQEIITGFNIKKLSAKDALASSNFQKGYTAKAFKNDKEITGSAKISTGTTIQIFNSAGKVVSEYTAVVYGDVTGKGNPGVADALMIIKNKTGKLKIDDNLSLEAARVTEGTRKSGGTPSVADALAIIKAKLGKYEISM